MNFTKLKVNLNRMKLNSAESFFNINGRFSSYEKDVYFMRYIGCKDKLSYISMIQRLEKSISARQTGYFRSSSLSIDMSADRLMFYESLYSSYTSGYNSGLDFKYKFKDPVLNATLAHAFARTIGLYKSCQPNATSSMIKNFSIKCLHWIDTYFPMVFTESCNLAYSPKFVFYGKIKLHEYLFLYLLTQCGCDVLYLNDFEDIALNEICKSLSFAVTEPVLEHTGLPIYVRHAENSSCCENKEDSTPSSSHSTAQRNKVSIPSHPRRAAAPAQNKKPSSPAKEPMDYEELAKTASSIVMIEVFDNKNNCFKTGSGVIIGSKGYILTNFHVACNAAFYSIRVEDSEETYTTKELLKYNQLSDLAILRMPLSLKPVPLYNGQSPLVRGQKVVAIGSPLGLFNSVSDGIISGFRKINKMSMIQFTAPISHGSSGGALLNMNGELIGLITAGFDDGQNLNLAVDYETLSTFVRGFID